MADKGNGKPRVPDEQVLPPPIARLFQVAARVGAETTWLIFSAGAYASAPTQEAKIALRQNASDLKAVAEVAPIVADEIVQWVETQLREHQGDA